MFLPFYLARKMRMGRTGAHSASPAIPIAISGIAIGVIVMLLTVAIVVGFKEEIQQRVTAFSGHCELTSIAPRTASELPPIHFSDSLTAKLLAVPSVTAVEPYISKSAVMKTAHDFLGVVVKGVPMEREFAGLQPLVSEREVLISRTIANTLQLKEGDTVPLYFVENDDTASDAFAYGASAASIKAKRLRVAGIYETHFSEIDQQMVIGALPLLQEVNGWDDDMVSGVQVWAASIQEAETCYWEVNALDLTDSHGTPLCVLSAEQLNPLVFSWIALLDTNVWFILILLAAVAAFTMISGLLIIILERTEMIALLKVQGLDNTRLRQTFLCVALFLTGRGMLWGNAIGLTLCYVQAHWHLIPLDPTDYYLEWVPIHLTPWIVLLVNLGTVVLTLLALLAPTAIVTKIEPVKALQHE